MRTVIHVYTENVEHNLVINFLSACHEPIMFTRSTFKRKYIYVFGVCGTHPQASELINRNNMTKGVPLLGELISNPPPPPADKM